MVARASLAGMPGRERVDVRIYEAAKSVPPVPPAPDGSRSARIKAWPLARYQERGEPCAVCSCLTGRMHRISLKQYEHLDPETTLVELIFHFVPVPYQSKEARGIRERAIRALRREYETIISWHDDAVRLTEDLADWNTRFPERPQTRERFFLEMHAHRSSREEFCRQIGLLDLDDLRALHEEYAERRPEVISSWRKLR